MNETERLRALQDLNILDSAAEPEFDALVAAAAAVCGVPISLISLVDVDRQWLKANTGLPGVSQTPREHAFCAHTLSSDEILEVHDATKDPRFAENPLVTSAPDIRFYAGAPLRLSDGANVGTLCVIDREPRQLSETQRTVLRHLATAAVKALESRRLARAFVESESRFRALSDAAPLGVFATDADGACTYTNSRWQAIYGASAEQARGFGWSRTLHPDDRDAVFAEWQRTAAAREDFDMEFRLVHDDGAIRHVRSIARPVVNERGIVTSFVGSVEDVSERRAQDVRLIRREQLLNRTGALAQTGGWELDLLSGELEWSEQTCHIHGVAPGYRPRLAEAIEFYAPEARAVVESAVEECIAHGTGWDLELPFIQANGTRIWVRAVGQAEFHDGKPVRLFGAFQDITLRVEQHRAIEVTRNRMALATDSGGIGVWDFDVAEGTLIWDEWMYRLYGAPSSTGTAPYDLWARHLHPDDRAAAEQALADAIAGTRDVDTEFRIVRSDGSLRHLRATARVTRDTSGAAVRLIGVNWDVTPMRRLAADLSDQHELLRVTLNSIGDAVITTDAVGAITWMNPVAERITGWRCDAARDRHVAEVFRIVDEESGLTAERLLASRHTHDADGLIVARMVLRSRDGVDYAIEESAAPIRNAQGDVLGLVLVFRDVTEQRRLAREMSHRASHDALTGLLNRAEFESRLQRTLNSAHADGSEHALLFIDLDQFKLVNDSCGHAVGDRLLLQVSELLQETVRTNDALARIGGDEFAVILERCSVEHARRVAQQICDRMNAFRFVHEDRRFRIGTSIGLAPVDRRWATLAGVMQAADTSCYAAKDAGRNRVHIWSDTDADMTARNGEIQWATRLEQALDCDEFVLHAQRIDSLTTASSGLHAEVLLRLPGADGALIPPGSFLPAAERFHLATRIDR